MKQTVTEHPKAQIFPGEDVPPDPPTTPYSGVFDLNCYTSRSMVEFESGIWYIYLCLWVLKPC